MKIFCFAIWSPDSGPGPDCTWRWGCSSLGNARAKIISYLRALHKSNWRYSIGDKRGIIIGGYLKNIPRPHTHRWPGAGRQRRLLIEISRFLGAGRHYYVLVEQEPNPVQGPHGWVECWDDERARGAVLSSGQLSSHIEATAWIEDYVLPQFSDHRVEISNTAATFYYLREGD